MKKVFQTFQPRKNLNHRFVAYLMVLSIIPLLGLGIASFEIARSALQGEAENSLAQLVGERQRFLDLQAEQAESLIANISGVEAITNALATPLLPDDDFTRLATQARIGYILNGYSDINGLVSIDVFSFTGAHFHVGDTLDVGHVNEPVLHDLKEKTAASERPVYWAGIIDNVNGYSKVAKTVTASKIIKTLNKDTLTHESVGMLLVNYDPAYWHGQFKSGQESDVRLAVVDKSMRLVDDTTLARVGMMADDGLIARLKDLIGPHPASPLDPDRLVSVLRSDVTGWFVAGIVPLAAVQRQANVIGNTTAMVVAACLMVAGVAACLYARNVVTPIRRISAQFQSLMEHGHHVQTRLPQRGEGDVAELTRSFNAFLDGQLERKQAEERQKLLIDELNHRVKNTLAVVQAIAHQTFHYSGMPEVFMKSFQSRLLALSKTHNLLTENIWQGVELHDVVHLELMPHANDDPSRLIVEGMNVCITPKAAVTLGLAFHELAMNAAKFGALSVPSGSVAVTWKRSVASERRIRLEWLEKGGPPVNIPTHQGFGSRLIEDGLACELAGTVRLDFLPQGLRCVMELPLDRVAVS